MTGLWFSTHCRHCTDPQPLVEVNAGHADGARSTWVGKCPTCRREYVVQASIAQVAGRGVPAMQR